MGPGVKSKYFTLKKCVVLQIQTTAVVNPYSMTENTIRIHKKKLPSCVYNLMQFTIFLSITSYFISNFVSLKLIA